MPRQLALELTPAEARILLVSAAESRVTIERSLTIPLSAETPDAVKPDPNQTILAALAAADLSRLDVIAVVGRADVELRLLNVPPTPDDELPNLVRFQAAQELSNLDADAPLDYLPLDEDPAQPRRVLAAVLKPEIKQRLESLCEAAHLTLSRIVLRSAASVSLALQEKPDLRDACFLLIEILGRRVEFAAVRRRRVVFLRHMLLADDPTDSPEAAENLSSEIRRTRAVVSSQEDGHRVESIVLFGEGPARRALADRLAADLDAPVQLLDPLPKSAVVDSRASLSQEDRYFATALVQAAADEASHRPPAFDFLHPRRPPKPPSRRGTYLLLGAVAAAVVLGLVVVSQLQTLSLRRELVRLQTESSDLNPKVKQAEASINAVEQIDKWQSGEVVWLDQLRWLSERLPSPADAQITKFTAVSGEKSQQISLGGLARDADAKAALDRALRDAAHQLVPETSEDRGAANPYRITFTSTLRLQSRVGRGPSPKRP